MRSIVVGLCALLGASSAIAAPVTWQDSGFITYVASQPYFPGLTVGTPWTIQVTFDPNGPFTPAALGQPGSNCNIYGSQSTAFSLGGTTYANGGGRVWTNSLLPGNACSPAPTGVVQFDWVGGWVVPAGAWDLNTGVLIAGYTDAGTKDGSLPLMPSLSGMSTGLGFYTPLSATSPTFQDRTFDPTAVVPEPATLVLVGIGITLGLRYIRRRQDLT